MLVLNCCVVWLYVTVDLIYHYLLLLMCFILHVTK
jgi:hypothetical protein